MSKTISLDQEAYEILKSRKLEGESFSDVIKKEILPWKTGKEIDAYLAEMARELKRNRKRNANEPAR